MNKFNTLNFTKNILDGVSSSISNSITANGSMAIAICVSYLTKGEQLLPQNLKENSGKFVKFNINLNKNFKFKLNFAKIIRKLMDEIIYSTLKFFILNDEKSQI